jgi:hypothetical protein
MGGTGNWRISRLALSAVLGSGVLLLVAAGPPRETIAGSWEGEIAQPGQWRMYTTIDIDPSSGNATWKVGGQTLDLGKAGTSEFSTTFKDPAGDQTLTGVLEAGHLRASLTDPASNVSFTLSRIAHVPAGVGRVAGWSADLDAMRNRVLRFDRSFSPRGRQSAYRQIEVLRKDLARLSDDAIKVRLARIMAIAGNAHTRLYLLRNRSDLPRLPIRVWWFGDDLRIVRATGAAEKLLGCTIAAINGVPAKTAFERVRPMYAGSPTWQRYMSEYTLTSPNVLHGVGIGAGNQSTKVAVSGCHSAGSHVLRPLPLERSEKAVESWWDLAPSSPSPLQGWHHFLEGKRLPRYLAKVTENYWFDESTNDKLFYLQLNRAANGGTESVSEFAKRAGERLKKSSAQAIVVDLRFNTGGDSNLTKSIIDAVVGSRANRPIYVIVSRSTFSAGIVAAAQLRTATHVTIVGEPVGDSLEFWAEGGNIRLPYSDLTAHFANGAHSLSPKPCPTSDFCNNLSVKTLAPDIPVTLIWRDYVSGIDPSLAAIRSAEATRRRSTRQHAAT